MTTFFPILLQSAMALALALTLTACSANDRKEGG